MRIRSSILAFALCLSAWAQTYHVKIENNVAVKMRDGVVLVADVYRPLADGKFPVILQRTPTTGRTARATTLPPPPTVT